MKNKKGQIFNKTEVTLVFTIVTVIVLLEIFSSLVPEAQTAGDDLNETGVPLGSLFASDGVIFILVMVGLFIIILNIILVIRKKNKGR